VSALDDGAVSAEIGYVYTFIISSILLTSITMLSTGMVNDSTRASLRMMLTDIATHVENEIGEVAATGAKTPNATIEKVVPLQPGGFTLSYSISATDHILYVNATYQDIRIKKPIMNPGDIRIRGTVSSSARAMLIRFHTVNGTAQIDMLVD